jgi:hypothetical protein
MGLADVVEAEQLQHQVMDTASARLDHGQAVVARVEAKEICPERRRDVVAEGKAQHVLIEPQQILGASDM